MTGGSVVESTTAEAVLIFGRVSSAGAKVAPSSGAGKWTVALANTSEYTITFTESYAEFMGCQVTLEAATGTYEIVSWTASTRKLLIKTFAVDGTTATAKAFSFTAAFSENRAP